MSIKLDGINCFYGAHQALFDITLQCPEGETLVLLGPSGAGKSSLLRVLNLLEMPKSGTLAIAGNQAVQRPLSAAPFRRPTAARSHCTCADDGAAGSAV